MSGNLPVLVTGGAGYIGSHAVLALQDAGFPVCVIDNLVTGFRWAVPAQVPFYQGDIADEALVDRICREQGIQAVMHFAGSVVVPESVENPLKYYFNNTAKTRTLIGSIVRNKVPHMLFSSTAAVYGIPEVVPVSEDMPTVPINPYGASKLMTEWMLRDCAAAYPLNYGALRYFNVAGADSKGRSGQSTRNATHLIKVGVEAALAKRDGVHVYGTDYPTRDGTGVRDYIHVADLARAHLSALRGLRSGALKRETLNCGYGRGYSVLDVVHAVSRANGGKTVPLVLSPRRAGDVGEVVADCSAILARTDWRPQDDDIDVIARDALAWEQSLENGAAARANEGAACAGG